MELVNKKFQPCLAVMIKNFSSELQYKISVLVSVYEEIGFDMRSQSNGHNFFSYKTAN
jgi:hypothetical protein